MGVHHIRSLWGFALKSYDFAIYCKIIPCKLPSGFSPRSPLIGIFCINMQKIYKVPQAPRH